MDGKVIAELMLLFANEATLHELQLTRDNIDSWAEEIDYCGGEEKIEFEIFALELSSSSSPERRQQFNGEVSVSLETIHALIYGIRAGVGEEMVRLAGRAKEYLTEKKRVTLKGNREKKVTPPWHAKALRLAEQGLASDVIAARLKHSVSQVRRVLNNAEKKRAR